MYIYVFPIKFYCFFNSWTTAWVPAWSRRTPVSWCTGGTPGPCPAPSGRSSVASLARRRTASLGCMRRRSGRLRSLVSVVINICCPRDAVSRTANGQCCDWLMRMALGFFAVGEFAVKKEKKTKPNLIWPNLIWPNLTETKFFFYGKLSCCEKSAHGWESVQCYDWSTRCMGLKCINIPYG